MNDGFLRQILTGSYWNVFFSIVDQKLSKSTIDQIEETTKHFQELPSFISLPLCFDGFHGLPVGGLA